MRKKLGELAIQYKWISEEELKEFLFLQQVRKNEEQDEGQKTKLGQILLEHGIFSSEVLEELLQEQQKNHNARAKKVKSTEEIGVTEEIERIEKGKTIRFSNPFSLDFSPTIMQQDFKGPRYQVVKELGQGGMGIVRLVKDNLLGREVALKSIHVEKNKAESLSKKQEMLLWRLYREASITATLEHPNIVPLYEMQRHGKGELQFTMRKVEGETLRNILNRMQRKLPGDYDRNSLLSIFLKVCDAVSYAHSKGIIHRDLKPENIMVGEFGEVYVMDWGIAKDISIKASSEEQQIQENIANFLTFPAEQKQSFYQTKGGLGTKGYLPPEQQTNATDVSYQADIYTLGKILQECFTGYPPLEEELSLKQLHSLEEKIPNEVKAIIGKMTKKEPSERYASVKEMTKDVQKFINHIPISIKKYNLLEIMLKWSIRHWKSILSLFTFILFAFSFLGYQYWKNRNLFLKIYEQAKEQRGQERRFVGKGKTQREQREKRIQFLLAAFSTLNKALLLSPKDQKAEAEKSSLGKQLIQLCYKTQDYQLATYIARELSHLSVLTETQKKALTKEVEFQKTRSLTQHKNRLDYWIERFKSGEIEEGEPIAFVFEVTQMQEDEIFESLLQLLQEGTKYLTENLVRDPKREELYKYVIEILGRLGNQSASFELYQSLEKIYLQTLHLPKNFIPETKLQYMIALIQALGNLEDLSYTKLLDDFYWKMSANHSFRIRMQTTRKKMIETIIEHYSKQIKNNPHSAKAYYQRGLAKKEKKKFKEAVLDFNQAVQQKTDFFQAYNSRGLTQQYQGNFEKALTDYNQAIELNPRYYEAYNNRGTLYQIQGVFDKAIRDFDLAIHLNPQFPTAYYNRGKVQKERGNHQAAFADFNKAIQIDPKLVVAYLSRGFAKEEKGDFAGAINDFSQAIEIFPLSFEAFYRRGVIKLEIGNLEGALVDFNQALRINPQLSQAYHRRGLTKILKEDLNSALADFNETIRINPQYVIAYNDRGIVKQKKGDFEGALKDFNQAIEQSPTSYEFYYNRAKLKKEIGNLAAAIKDYTKTIELNATFFAAYYDCGLIQKEIKDFKGAIQNFSQAITLKPKAFELYNERGLAKKEMGNFSGAILDFNQAVLLNIDSAEIYNNRGSVKMLQENFQGALVDFNLALQSDSQHIAAMYNMGKLYLKVKKYDTAIQIFIEGAKIQSKPFSQILGDLLIERMLRSMKKKEFKLAKKDLLLFNEYAPIHPKRKQFAQFLEEIEKEIWKAKKQKKKNQ